MLSFFGNGVFEGVVGEYDVVLSRFVLFLRGLGGPVVPLFLLSVDCEVFGAFSFVDSLLAPPVFSLGDSFDFKLPSFFTLSRVKQNQDKKATLVANRTLLNLFNIYRTIQ